MAFVELYIYMFSAERTRKHDFFFFCAQICMFKAEKSGLKRSRNGQAEKSGLKRSRNGKAEKSGLKRQSVVISANC